MVPVHAVIFMMALLFAFVSITSLAIWFFTGAVVLNPLVATLWLIAVPFFYAMGHVAKKKFEEENKSE